MEYIEINYGAILGWTVLAWLLNVLACVIFHLANESTFPETGWMLFRMTFIPYVLINYNKLK